MLDSLGKVDDPWLERLYDVAGKATILYPNQQ